MEIVYVLWIAGIIFGLMWGIVTSLLNDEDYPPVWVWFARVYKRVNWFGAIQFSFLLLLIFPAVIASMIAEVIGIAIRGLIRLGLK